MFSRFKNFVSRHRRKFLVGSIVIGGAIIGMRYAQRKFLEWQEKEVKEFLERSRKERHFRNTERTCNQTINKLAETLKETILRIVDSETILSRIRKGDENKVVLWQDLKVKVFTQACSLVYAGLMLVIVLRIQINLMSGYMFREKMEDESNRDLNTFKDNYLSLCEYFLTEGAKELISLIEKHVTLVLENISLKQKLSLQDIEHIFWRIHSSLNCDPADPIKNLSLYLFPNYNSLEFHGKDSNVIKHMVNETFELLESEKIVSISGSSIKRAFSNIVDQIACYYLPNQEVNLNTKQINHLNNNNTNCDKSQVFQNITEITVPMAKVISIIHGIVKAPMTSNEVEPWIHQYLLMEKINMLGANLFEAFSYPSDTVV